jgi:hypothetical protein
MFRACARDCGNTLEDGFSYEKVLAQAPSGHAPASALYVDATVCKGHPHLST